MIRLAALNNHLFKYVMLLEMVVTSKIVLASAVREIIRAFRDIKTMKMILSPHFITLEDRMLVKTGLQKLKISGILEIAMVMA